MKILFVCKFNRFRSKVADAYFRKINRNKEIQSDNAGIIAGNPVNRNVKKIGRKLEFRVGGKPKGVSERLLKDVDLVVIVADNVPASIFRNLVKKVIVWKIPDTNQNDLRRIGEISRNIMKKVEELNRRLKKNGR